MPNYRVKSKNGSLVAIDASNATVSFDLDGEYLLKNAELKEVKEEENCWCKYPAEDRFSSVFVHPSRGGRRPIRIEIDFCPQCGRFLKG